MKVIRFQTAILLIGLALSSNSVAGDLTVNNEFSADPDLVERGRYIVHVAGCNDCHTPGYAINEGDVPQEKWLTGDDFGWRGPWGTTYGTNLRIFMNAISENQWIQLARTLRRRPPMPWFNLNAMSEDDLRALYHFTRALGDPGLPAPAALPPEEEPTTAYAMWTRGNQPEDQ
jgi:mono/diheme cytochrome c family protein